MAKYAINEQLNGVEIRFDARPAAAVIGRLKSAGWKWSWRNACWFTIDTPDARAFAAAFVAEPETPAVFAEADAKAERPAQTAKPAKAKAPKPEKVGEMLHQAKGKGRKSPRRGFDAEGRNMKRYNPFEDQAEAPDNGWNVIPAGKEIETPPTVAPVAPVPEARGVVSLGFFPAPPVAPQEPAAVAPNNIVPFPATDWRAKLRARWQGSVN
jgi:hypothetical protein